MGAIWTQEESETAISLWKAGSLSAKEIGAVISKTRNSVIGYMHRYQIKRDGPAPLPKVKPVFGPPKPRAPRKSRAKVKPETAPRLVVRGIEPVPARGVRLIALREYNCRWPLGAAMDAPEFFCGQPKQVGKSYCPECCKKAYQPFRPVVRKRAA